MNLILLLGILLLLGIAATRVTRLIGLPNVTGFLVIGVVIAGVCLLIDKTGFLTMEGNSLSTTLSNLNGFVSSVALGFIALSIGEEFKISKIKTYGKKIILITFLQALAAVAFVDISLLIACACMKLNYAIAICLGAIATATAPAATLMVIHQYKAKGPLVNILLPVVAFDDAIGLIVFSVSVSLSKLFVSGNVSAVSIILVPLISIIGSLVVGFILGFGLHLVINFFKSRTNHMITIIAFTLFGVGLCSLLSLIKIDGDNLEFSSLLCCMMTGAVYVNFANNQSKPIIERDIDIMERWTGFLFTLFFVLSGAHLVTSAYDIFSNNSIHYLVPLVVVFICYILFRSLGKYFGSYLGCQITRQDPHIKKYLGFTLLPQAGVAIGMANQISGIEIFKIDNIGNIIVTVVLCATLIYELFGPLLTKWSLNKAGEIPSSPIESNSL